MIRIQGKVVQIKRSYNRELKVKQYMILIATPGGIQRPTWTREDLKNYSAWREVILSGVGTIIGNLNIRDDGSVDADSDIEILGTGQKSK